MKYNFYKYLNVNIVTNGHKGYLKYFNNEYARIANEFNVTGAPTVTVKIVKHLPRHEDGDIVKSERYSNLFKFSFIIRGVKNKSTNVTIFFKRHWVDKVYMNAIGVFVQAQLLEPIMYLKLLEQNVLFMHAGGVADDKNGFLLPAYGGTGKTTFSIALLNKGYKLLGDDLLFVALDEKKVYPYPRPMHIFTYNINNLNGATIPLKYKLAIYSKNVIRYILRFVFRHEFLISTRIHADEVFTDDPFGKSVKYKSIFFLKKDGPATKVKEINKSNVKDFAVEIMESEDLNDSLYELVNDTKTIDTIKQLEIKVISNLLMQFRDITYVNTHKLDLNNLNQFIKKYLK